MPSKPKRKAAASPAAIKERPSREAKKKAKKTPKMQTPKQAAARVCKAFPDFAQPRDDQQTTGHFKAALRALVGLGDSEDEKKLFDCFDCGMGLTAYQRDEAWFEQIGANAAHQQTLNDLLKFLFQTAQSDAAVEKTRQEYVTKTKAVFATAEDFAVMLHLATNPHRAQVKRTLAYLGSEW